MRPQIFWRKVHYWLSVMVALPLLVIIMTGLLLQVKKDVAWIQPPEQRGHGGPPTVTFDQVLAICAAIPQVDVKGWEDVRRLDFRPEKGLLKVITANDWEVQIDPVDGRVMNVAVRRSDVIEALHDGSWFGAGVKRGVFLPAGALLLVMWATGIYLFLLPQFRRKRNAQPLGRSQSGTISV